MIPWMNSNLCHFPSWMLLLVDPFLARIKLMDSYWKLYLARMSKNTAKTFILLWAGELSKVKARRNIQKRVSWIFAWPWDSYQLHYFARCPYCSTCMAFKGECVHTLFWVSSHFLAYKGACYCSWYLCSKTHWCGSSYAISYTFEPKWQNKVFVDNENMLTILKCLLSTVARHLCHFCQVSPYQSKPGMTPAVYFYVKIQIVFGSLLQ